MVNVYPSNSISTQVKVLLGAVATQQSPMRVYREAYLIGLSLRPLPICLLLRSVEGVGRTFHEEDNEGREEDWEARTVRQLIIVTYN